jgi:hypothetical protein
VAYTSVGDALGVSISCSMDVFNVGRIMRSMYCNALLGGVMVFISPLLDGICFQMLALDNNLENEKSSHGSLVGNSKMSCLFSSFDNKGSSFNVLPLSKLKRTLNIEFSNNIFLLYHVVGLAPFVFPILLLINFILYYGRMSVNSNSIHTMWWNKLATKWDRQWAQIYIHFDNFGMVTKKFWSPQV